MNEKDGFKLKVTSSTKRSEEPVYIDDKVIPKMNFGGDTGIDADYEQAAADADVNFVSNKSWETKMEIITDIIVIWIMLLIYQILRRLENE